MLNINKDKVSVTNMTYNRKRAISILGIIEDYLADKDVKIENPERDDIEDVAILCGSDYYDLEDRITEILDK